MSVSHSRLNTVMALVQDRPGVLAKVTMVLRRRNFNVASLAVGHSETPGISRMTIVVEGDGAAVKQVEKQLYKVIEVLKVNDLSGIDTVQKEVALIRIAATGANRAEIISLARVFGGRVDDVGRDHLMIELTASPYSIDRFLQIAKDFGILELARTGVVAMARGSIAARPIMATAGSNNGQGNN